VKPYYARTFAGLALALLLLTVAALLSNSIAADAKDRNLQVVQSGKLIADQSDTQRVKTARLQAAIGPVRDFTAAWQPFMRVSEKEAAEKIRSDLEAIAQRQLGLVTDSAITPAPEKYTFQGVATRVQRVTLRASGNDLAALLTWLGKVEEKYPAALVEACDFSSNVGGNTGLTIRLAQAVTEPTAPRSFFMPTMEVAALPDAIATVAWARYLPMSLKRALPIGISRNPLQPAVTREGRALPVVRDESDEITPRIESALDGRLRSVIRGATPIVVIDGRVFRIGDELVIGHARKKLVPETKTKLKQIGDDRLILQVSGGTTDRPIQCDVAYALPSFLQAR